MSMVVGVQETVDSHAEVVVKLVVLEIVEEVAMVQEADPKIFFNFFNSKLSV